ncbi:hypothetical protein V6N11_074807 [Hibiscus sabdariffa]|uniref:Pentatricopeptide repeat-containing protein n=1 Tax=Hibiscus sabdariffa TaxID=183260 RepID=A0ABR2R4M7_9ROSI
MGKLHSSSSILNAVRHLSNSISSLPSSVTHMSGKGSPKKHDRFDNVDGALALFNKMIQKYPKPSIVEFTKLLAPIVRMKHYSLVVSMCSQLELFGVSHNVYSLNILVNCFCQLGRVDFGLSVLGKMLKLGVEPNVVTFSTLINGLVKGSKFSLAVSLFDEMVEKGYQPNLITYSIILNGLSKIGDTDRAVMFLRLMEERGFKPNVVAYGTVIDCLCKNGLLEEALHLFSELMD